MGKSCINEPKVATIKRPDERIVKETWIKNIKFMQDEAKELGDDIANISPFKIAL